MGKTRVVLMMSDEAARVLEQSTTPRKRAEYVSELVLRYAGAPEDLRPQPGILERIEQRLEHIEYLLMSVPI